jgi:predicted amidophosphoribosyltransferase
MRPCDLVSLLAPPRCVACGAAADPRRTLCHSCEAALRAARPGEGWLAIEGGRTLAVHWASEYSGVARGLIHALKFGKRLVAANAIATAIVNTSPEILRFASGLGGSRSVEGRQVVGGVTLVPVPAAPRRRRWRGFDPAEEIAVALARETGLEFRACLARDEGPRQVGRGRSERLSDPPRVRVVGPVPPACLLVDDVFTTGATLAACARVLGDVAVGACVFARALGPGRWEA